MYRLRTKTSQFFRNSPTQDEKVAITPTEQEFDFDAGIERGMKKKPSRFFRKQNDKVLPTPPYIDPSEGPPPPLPKDHERIERAGATSAVAVDTTSKDTDKPLPSRPASCLSASSEAQTTSDEARHDAVCKTKQADPKLKKRPSLAVLRKSGSRIFRLNTSDHNAPPPPMPQIPMDVPSPKLRRSLLRPAESNRSSRSSQSSKARVTSISRPIPSAQYNLRPDLDPTRNHPRPNPNGPPPPRPARSGSIDEDIAAMARDGVARTMVQTPTRARTLTASTASSAWSPALSRVNSEEAYSRLGLPSGHSSVSPPRSPVFDSPLSANFPMDPSMPLPFRNSDGSVLGYGRFSAYIKARQGYGSGGYADGVEEGDRDKGPVEMYCQSRCADWTLEQRVSGKLGERGMMFRDRWGGWHLVKDI